MPLGKEPTSNPASRSTRRRPLLTRKSPFESGVEPASAIEPACSVQRQPGHVAFSRVGEGGVGRHFSGRGDGPNLADWRQAHVDGVLRVHSDALGEFARRSVEGHHLGHRLAGLRDGVRGGQVGSDLQLTEAALGVPIGIVQAEDDVVVAGRADPRADDV